MKQTKKLLSLVLVLSMILSMFAGLTTTASAADETYTLFTESEIVPGKYVIVDDSKNVAMTSTVESKWIRPSSTTFTGDTINNPDATVVMEINADGQIAVNGGQQIYCPATKNVTTAATGTQFTFTLKDNTWTISAGSKIGTLRLNGTSGWRPYTGTTGTAPVRLYKLEAGTPSEEKYALTYAQPTEGGTFTVADSEGNNVATGAEVNGGATLTVTVTYADGFDKATVTLGDQTKELANGETSCTVKMPNEAADLKVVFAKTPAYTLTIDAVEGGELKVTDAEGTAVESGASIKEGAELTITATPTGDNDMAVVTFDGAEQTLKDNTCTVTMPNHDATVAATFSETPTTPIGEANVKGTSYTVRGVITFIDNKNVYIQDKTGAVCAYLTAADSSLQVGETIQATGSYTVYNQLPELNNATAVKVTDETKQIALADVLVETSDLSKVTVICGAYKLTGMKITVAGTTNAQITDANGNTMTLYKPAKANIAVGETYMITGALGAYKALQFRTSSESDFVQEAGATKYSITLTQPNEAIGTIAASAPEAAEGEKVTLSYNITDADYKFGAFTVTTENGETVEVAEDNTFVMPAKNVTVSASFVEKELITVNFVVNGTTAKSIVAIEGYKASVVGMPEDPEAIGAYEFMGWTTNETVTDASFIKFDGDTVIDLHTPGIVKDENDNYTLTVRAVFATKTGAGSADTFKLSATDKDGGVHYAGSVTKSYFESVDNAADAAVFGMEKAEVEGVDNAYYVYYMNGDVKTYLSGTSSLTFVTADKVTETNKPSYFLMETTENGFTLQINNTDGKFFAYNSQSPRFTLYLSSYASGIFELNKAGSSSYGDYTIAPSADTNKAGNDISLVFNYDADMVVTLKNLIPDVQEDMVQSIGLKIADEDKYDLIVSDNASFTAMVVDNTIIVSLEKSMISSSLGFTYQVVLKTGLTYTGTITLVSGNEIYYDDASGFFTYEGGWKSAGEQSSIQLPYDENGSDVTDKFNTLEHHAGTVHTATVEAGKNASVSFSFTGTGFELIAATSATSGAVKIEVTGKDNKTKSYVVDTYYGCTYDAETKTWTVNPDATETVYQSPVARIEGLTYGTYTVKVTAIYSKVFDHTGLESYEFYFDGVRILWPMGENGEFDGINIREGLKSDAPGSVVYIDGASGITVADMKNVGNPNEVMLAKGQAIAFKATASSLTDLRIGARAVTGTRSQLSFYADGTLTNRMHYINLNSSTEMHYTLPYADASEVGRENGLTWTKEENGSFSITVIVKNTGDGICALSDLILDGAVVTFTNDVQQTAAAFAKRLYANEQTFTSLTDVAEGAWYYDAVKTAVEAGIMNGTNNATFVPGNELTRAELVQVLYNVAGKPAVEFTGRFSDVSENAWFASAVEWAAANGITLGNGKGEFNPNGLLTREQMVTFLYRFVGAAAVAEDATASFVDGSTVSNFAAEAMNWAVANGIVNGVGNNTLAPKANATRASIAKIMTVNISLLAK